MVTFILLSTLAFGKSLPVPPTGEAHKISCPQLNFFNIRRQTRTDLLIDPPPKGWELVATQNQSGKEDAWYPTVPAGASVEIRKNEVYLRCEYKPRNWVQRWVLGSATLEKNLGPYRQGMLCWTFEGVERRPVHRMLGKEEPIFLPCLEGTCELVCS